MSATTMKHQHNIVLLTQDSRYHERRTARGDAAISAAALRVRKSRERRRNGEIVLPPHTIKENMMEYLIRYGYLQCWCEDPVEIVRALERLYDLLCAEDQLP
jgi:hypothetical protein